MQNSCAASEAWRLQSLSLEKGTGAAGTATRPALLRERHIRRGISMNRNVTISLGALIVIIIIVALVF